MSNETQPKESNSLLGTSNMAYESMEVHADGTRTYHGVKMGDVYIANLNVAGRVIVESTTSTPSQERSVSVSPSPSESAHAGLYEILNQEPPERPVLQFSSEVTRNTVANLDTLTTGIGIARKNGATGSEDLKALRQAEEQLTSTVGISKHVPVGLRPLTDAALNLLSARDFPPEVKQAMQRVGEGVSDKALYLLVQQSLRQGGVDATNAQELVARIVSAYAVIRDTRALVDDGLPVTTVQRKNLHGLYITSSNSPELNEIAASISAQLSAEVPIIDTALNTIKPMYERGKQYVDIGPFNPMDPANIRPVARRR